MTVLKFIYQSNELYHPWHEYFLDSFDGFDAFKYVQPFLQLQMFILICFIFIKFFTVYFNLINYRGPFCHCFLEIFDI